jgi:K+/H+ antiporter YhaU regulatory subunit KhtT
MSTISEVFLPGVGRKFQVETITGDRLVIVIHDDGLRELYHFTRPDLDRPASVLRLSDGEGDRSRAETESTDRRGSAWRRLVSLGRYRLIKRRQAAALQGG